MFLLCLGRPFLRETFRGFDVLLLGALVAATEKDNDGVSLLLQVNPVSGTVADSQFADPLPYWLYIAGMPETQPIETRGDQARARSSLSRSRHFRKYRFA
jgi:hypothetical protein